MDDFVKITGEEEEHYSEYLTESVLETRNMLLGAYDCELCEAITDCESPIEQMMALTLFDCRDRIENTFVDKIYWLSTSKQEEIKIKKKKYRVDFLIHFVFKSKKNIGELNLIIECDGHNFHEKTKEQVAKGNERDRELQKEGYDILHFSGSEIYNHLFKCEKEIIEYVKAKYDTFCKESGR